MFYFYFFFFFNDTATTEIYTLSLHDALPIYTAVCPRVYGARCRTPCGPPRNPCSQRSEEHTSELQSLRHLVCRLLLEKKKTKKKQINKQENTICTKYNKKHNRHICRSRSGMR